jgi:hypothetical protein
LLAHATNVLGVLTWDPQIRGALILVTAITILCGSVYLLLATNLGSRLGFLVAVAGLTGWMTVLGLMWTITPSTTGPKGRDPHWKVKGVVTGNLGPTAPAPLQVSLEDNKVWKELPEEDPQRAEIITTSEEFFTTDPAGGSYGIQGSSDYIVEDAWSRGGQRKGPFGVLNFRPFNVRHEPHYAVVRMHPTIKQETKPGQAPPTPKVDPAKDAYTVLLVRDLGTRRLPVAMFALGSGILFAVTLSVLHRRDKEAMAARGLLPAKA